MSFPANNGALDAVAADPTSPPALVAGVEALLTSLAPGLSSLLDPLLHTVYALTAGLGLNLNLPSA